MAHGRLEADRGDDEDHLVQLVPATVAKGLEFDRVIVAEPVGIWTQSRTSAPASVAFYVVLTRAVSELTVLHARPLPQPLR